MTDGLSAAQRVRRIFVRIAAIAAVVVISFGVALLLAEGVVRLAAPQQLIQIRPDLWEPVDTLGYMRRANISVEMNTGERTVKVISDADRYRVGQAGRPSGGRQAMMIGDSFIEALQVDHEQTVVYHLERLLNDAGHRMSVRNAGVTGWNPNHYLLRARQLLSRDTFALIVVGLFVGNDAVEYRFDRIGPREPVARHDFRVPTSFAWKDWVNGVFGPVNDALEVRSHLYILAKNQLSTLRMRLGVTAEYLPVEYRRDESDSPRWRNTADLSLDLARLADSCGARTLFVLIPERFQVYPDEFRRYLNGFGIDSTTVDVDQPSRLLARELGARNLHFVDALPGMRAAAGAAENRLYGRVDQHLSPEGHKVLAQIVAPEAMRLLTR